MKSLLISISPPEPCEYLHDRSRQLQYEVVAEMTRAEYGARLLGGWRRFGRVLFRPVCTTCRMCQSLRVPVESFKPDRSQRRAWKLNVGAVSIAIRTPSVTPEKLFLHERFHRYQQETKGWPRENADYHEMLVDNPIATEEWQYTLADGRLAGVGYIDQLDDGLSAIYFFHDPDERRRSLGTFNVLSVIDEARRRGLTFVYLGYYVEGCRSLEYKARFRPYEVLMHGRWQPTIQAVPTGVDPAEMR
jgi:arginine-tRNA-protein transferase